MLAGCPNEGKTEDEEEPEAPIRNIRRVCSVLGQHVVYMCGVAWEALYNCFEDAVTKHSTLAIIRLDHH